ncbi:MAG: NAD(P)H-dependent oxidoreductase [Bacteroidales bacterium]|jgi:flavodoxin|nr:NAD(P)H-dependent oxidoreductase [Bacteroidales bacterium]
MKKIMCLVASAVALSGAVQAQSKEKTLIAYFSWGGNTREMAKQIQEQTGGDLFEIKTVELYPTDYNECVNVAKKEQQAGTRPPLAAEVKDIVAYDVVFVGYPNWWGTMPQVLFTFLEKYNMSGKTVVPFCTHGGGRWGRSLNDLKKLCSDAIVLEGLAISGNLVRRSKDDVAKWLQKIGITNSKQQ